MQILHFDQDLVKFMHSALRLLDLNLLLLFDALYRHRSVVAAADELAISPSACSHALARMRQSLSDELFVRSGSAMQPTARAEHMASAVADALRILGEQMMGSAPFVPATASQTFVFAATDYCIHTLLTPLIAKLEKTAPGLRLDVRYLARQECLTGLREGRVHFALDTRHAQEVAPEGLDALDCFSDDYVVAVRKGHPRIRGELSLDQYLAERHVVVLPWRDTGSVIAAALAGQGMQREVAVQLPSVLAAPHIVAASDYLATLPRRAVGPLSRTGALELYPPPFVAPCYTLGLLSNARYSSTAAHRWMREQMLAAMEIPVPSNSVAAGSGPVF